MVQLSYLFIYFFGNFKSTSELKDGAMERNLSEYALLLQKSCVDVC